MIYLILYFHLISKFSKVSMFNIYNQKKMLQRHLIVC